MTLTLNNGFGAQFSANTLKPRGEQRLAAVEFVAELPRNPNGKILKRELRTRYAERVYD